MSILPIWSLWLVLCGILLIVEIFTVTFLFFFPAVGAFLAYLTCILGFSVPIQIAVFAISTTLMIIFIKPLTKKLFKSKDIPMNSNSLINAKGIVVKTIDNINSTGQVKVKGELWSAISESGEPIEVQENVEIIRVEGVKLVVKKC